MVELTDTTPGDDINRSNFLGQIGAAQLPRRDDDLNLAHRALIDVKSRALRQEYDDLAQYAKDERSKTLQETAR